MKAEDKRPKREREGEGTAADDLNAELQLSAYGKQPYKALRIFSNMLEKIVN